MNILFRVDAGGNVGLGHFYRSYGLAQSIAKRGHQVKFVHRTSDFWNTLDHFEFEHFSYPDSHCDEHMVSLCSELSCDILYVDGIVNFDPSIFAYISENTKVVFYQNISDARHLCDIFILPSIHQTPSFFTNFSKKTQIYQGLEYVLFNPKIKSLPSKTTSSLDQVNRIGVITGGSDPKNVLLRLYELLEVKRWSDITFDFYVGNNFMFVPLLPKKTPVNVNFLPYDFDKIIESDIVISTFGVSSYELLSLGMPLISLGHQKANERASNILQAETDSFTHIGNIDDITSGILNTALDVLITERERREKYNLRAKSLLDYNSEERIISILES